MVAFWRGSGPLFIPMLFAPAEKRPGTVVRHRAKAGRLAGIHFLKRNRFAGGGQS